MKEFKGEMQSCFGHLGPSVRQVGRGRDRGPSGSFGRR